MGLGSSSTDSLCPLPALGVQVMLDVTSSMSCTPSRTRRRRRRQGASAGERRTLNLSQVVMVAAVGLCSTGGLFASALPWSGHESTPRNNLLPREPRLLPRQTNSHSNSTRHVPTLDTNSTLVSNAAATNALTMQKATMIKGLLSSTANKRSV